MSVKHQVILPFTRELTCIIKLLCFALIALNCTLQYCLLVGVLCILDVDFLFLFCFLFVKYVFNLLVFGMMQKERFIV